MSVEIPEARNEGLTVMLLELVKATAVEDATQYCIHVKWLFVVHWNDSVEVLRIEKWLLRLGSVLSILLVPRLTLEVLDN